MRCVCPECGCPYEANLLHCPECGCPNESIDSRKQDEMYQQAVAELTDLRQEKEAIAEMQADLAAAHANRETARSLVRSLKRVFLSCDNFSGRSRRSEFWIFVAFNVLVSVMLYIILFSCIGRDYIYISSAATDKEYWFRLIRSCISNHLIVTLIILGYLLLILLPLLAVTVRRLHDINRSGFWILLGIVPSVLAPMAGISPYIGLLLLSAMLLLDSAPSNKYGKLLRLPKKKK